MKLEGQVAIVTGAASGIGRVIAHRLAKEGANVVVSDIMLEGSKKVVDEIKAWTAAKAIAIKTDVTSSAEVNRMVKTTLGEFGKIDILICNAGGRGPAEGGGPFEKTTDDGLSSVLDLNLKSVFICSRAVVEHMIRQRSGKIIGMSSHCGVIGCRGGVAMSAAKAGIIGFTKALAKELGPYGITVNCLAPAAILTAPVLADPALQEAMKRDSWLHRLAKPEEVANAVAFLVSDEASFITGHTLTVSGGRDLGW